MRSRRSYLVGIGSVGTVSLLGGCLSALEEESEDSSDGDGSPTGSTGSNQPETTRENVLDTTTSISEDRYAYWSWDLNQQTTLEYSYSVNNDIDIDVFVTDNNGFTSYKNGDSFSSNSSNSGTSGQDSLNLGGGEHYLIVDNTNAGLVSPPTNFDDDIADVSIEAYLES